MIVMDADNPSAVAATPLSRQQILETTARCLAQEGYDATTIRRIAAMLDCAVGSIYRYFRDKRDLLDAVTQASLEPAAAAVEAGGSVIQTARRYHELASADLANYRLMFWIHAVAQTAGDVMPDVVNRILTGWSRRLGDDASARRAWMTLHGSIMLGLDCEQTLALIDETLSPKAAGPTAANSVPSPRRTPRAAAMITRPVVVQTEPAEEPTTAPMADHLASEDVVLL